MKMKGKIGVDLLYKHSRSAKEEEKEKVETYHKCVS